MKLNRFVPTILLVGAVGCAVYQMQPLGINHPANPQAMAAPQHSPSRTLAYTRSSPATSSETALQTDHQKHHPSTDKDGQKTVVGNGKVIATVPSANQIVLEHGEINGFMEAMTMGYRVEPAALLEQVKAGDQVRFTIDVDKKAIVKIEKAK